MPATPLNENFWLCHCEPPDDVRNALLEDCCPKCDRNQLRAPLASQQQINESALALAHRQEVVRNRKPELPHARKKEPPTREEFEAAVDKLSDKVASHERYLAQYPNKEPLFYAIARAAYKKSLEDSPEALIIKRYKHHHEQADRKATQTKLV